MAEFRKSGGFGGKRPGGYRPGGDRPSFARKSFGGPRRDDSGPREMFSATCASCGKTCEVPFRPSAGRPVFCKDCFDGQREGGGREHRDERPRFDKPRFDAPRHFEKHSATTFTVPAGKPTATDPRIDEVKRSVDALNKKLDAVMGMIEGLALGKTEKAPKVEITKVVKKVVAKKKTAKQ